MPVKLSASGSFSKTERYLSQLAKLDARAILEKFGQAGVNALASATPTDTGATSEAWAYEIVEENGDFTIYWTNANVNEGQHIAILVQYGHGTGTGGYVVGRDYINPAIKPVFDQIAAEIEQEVKSA